MHWRQARPADRDTLAYSLVVAGFLFAVVNGAIVFAATSPMSMSVCNTTAPRLY
jgi:hypothetical protein